MIRFLDKEVYTIFKGGGKVERLMGTFFEKRIAYNRYYSSAGR